MAKALGPMKRGDVVARAAFAIGRQTAYKLGAGGRDPRAAHPAVDGRCDCSGFAAWCLGIDRYLPNDLMEALPVFEKWFETGQLYADARSPWGIVTEVPWLSALPGDVLLRGDEGKRQGHIGVVTACDHTGPIRVVHCSSGNWRTEGDAIQETGVELFVRNRALAARVRWVA